MNITSANSESPKEFIMSFNSSSEISIKPLHFEDEITISKDFSDHVSTIISSLAFLISAITLVWSILQNKKQAKFQANLRRDEFLIIPTLKKRFDDTIFINENPEQKTVDFEIELLNHSDDQKTVLIDINEIKLNEKKLTKRYFFDQVTNQKNRVKIDDYEHGDTKSKSLIFQNLDNTLLLKGQNKIFIKYQDLFERTHKFELILELREIGKNNQKILTFISQKNILNQDDI